MKSPFLLLTLLLPLGGAAQTLSYPLGDANGNGAVTVADVSTLASVLQGQTVPAFWHESDGRPGIDLGDLEATVRLVLGQDEGTTVDARHRYARYEIDVAAGQTTARSASVRQAVCYVNGETLPTDALPLDHYLTRLKVQTSLAGVVSVSAYAEDRSAIAGPVTLTTNGDEVPQFAYGSGQRVAYGSSEASDVVTLYTDGGGSSTASPQGYELLLRPVNLSRGVLVTLRTSDGGTYSQHFDVEPGKENVLQFTQTTSQNLWMSTLPGGTWLSMLSVPGAHDAATSSITVPVVSGTARCQEYSIAEMLARGVRAFDLRPRYNSSKESDIQLENLTISHGIIDTGVRFVDAIDALVSFVREHPSETVSVLMQKENASGTDYSETWRTSIRECFNDPARRPYLLDEFQGSLRLDDVRGKVCVVSRTPYGAGGYYTDIVGAIFNGWADNTSVTDYSGRLYVNGNRVTCTANLQDLYDTNANAKKPAFDEMLRYSSTNTDPSRYHYNYTSIAYKFLGTSIENNAKTMNPYAATALDEATGPAGFIYSDYIGSKNHSGDRLLRSIIDLNHRYAYKGLMGDF